MDYCKYVNVFQGNGEIDLPKPEGLAAKWFFIKAGCGNTSPAALVPFGGMSVSPYSGGYPTGYTNHEMNSHSRPKKFKDGEKILGFAHLQQSGTGAIGYYYNYAVVTPKYSYSEKRRLPINEYAKPGYYRCEIDDILCELTSENNVSHHRYTFNSDGGFVTIDFGNNGLDIPNTEKKKADVLSIEKKDENTVCVKAVIEGITLYFAVKGNGTFSVCDTTVKYIPDSKTFLLDVAISLTDNKKAFRYIENGTDFDTAEKEAYSLWNSELSKLKIETKDERIKEIFYSNLYHSFVKPANWNGESFLYGESKPFTVDLNTLWDMYKTELPLIFMTNKNMGEDICETLLLLGETLGLMPNSIGISEEYKEKQEQARMLGAYALITAYRYGVKINVKRMLNVITADVFADNKLDFTKEGKCRSHTWMLDMADGCALASKIAHEQGETEIYNKLYPLSLQWQKCYDKNTGLLGNDSQYYEGTLYNYSFRQMVDMEKRMEIAGGKERFVSLLDKFFGYGQPDTVQPTDPYSYEPVAEGIKLGRFEGFNNESDTEAPFSYIYADRHDKTSEVIRAGMKYMFTTGKGGIPGNNDTGALSSYYCFMAFGIFPVAGQDLFLIGSPFIDKGEITLFNGNKLTVNVKNNSEESIYVKSVKFNNKELSGYKLSASELFKGGTLDFIMTNTK